SNHHGIKSSSNEIEDQNYHNFSQYKIQLKADFIKEYYEKVELDPKFSASFLGRDPKYNFSREVAHELGAQNATKITRLYPRKLEVVEKVIQKMFKLEIERKIPVSDKRLKEIALQADVLMAPYLDPNMEPDPIGFSDGWLSRFKKKLWHFDETGLTHLDLHDNQIQALPNKISQLSNLVVLQLCTNHLHLQHLSDEIGKLNKLQELKFENNPLRSLPKTIQRLPNARRVHQQGCEHRDLPVELGTAFELIYLDLSSSQFEVMPALNHMTKLEEFYISNNYLREIGASSLNLQSSNNSTNSYNSGTVSVGSGAGLISSVSTKHGSSSQGDLNAGTGTIQGGVTNSSVGQGVAAGTAMTGGGVTVLDLGYNLLAWLPKEVGDLADLKVLILEGNPIKSLQSSLVELVAYAVTYKLSDSFYVVEEQEQAPMNMKVNVLQSITPQQIERTSLMRIHDSILKRVQELDSQQYRDQHDPDNNNGSRSISRAITKTQLRVPGTTFALASSAMSTLQ
ncbi:Leucine-rich repeat, immunoglobulin-like domain and transmembrane domain-containing protein 1, partial [Haplosporangium sp. Z 767]